jgi:PAS domain S-box-containing protein
MKYTLRFLGIYIIIIVSIVSFYFTITQEYRTTLNLIEKEKKGMEYIKNLYLLTNNVIEYKSRVDIQNSEDGLELFKSELIDEISHIIHLRKEIFSQENDELVESFVNLLTLHSKTTTLYELLEIINDENYHIGDLSGLFFQADRKTYYLNSLITHYLPEYIISLSIVRSIVEYEHHIGSIDKERSNILIEQNKLVFLSSVELSTIIRFLEIYPETKPLQKIMLKVKNRLDSLKTPPSDIHKYLEELTEVLLSSHRLNKMTINTLEKLYINKGKATKHQILLYQSWLFLSIMIVTLLTLYFMKVFNTNLKNEEYIKHLNETLDKLVVFTKTDSDGFITHVSDAFLELSGFSKDDFIGKKDSICKKIDLEDQNNQISEVKNRAKNGTYYWLKLQIIPEIDKKGDVVSYMIYGIDITYQKKIEEEKIKTQEALSFKSKFLSNMSHEIRTPLNGIIGFTTIALKTKLDEKQKDLMSKIKATSNLLLGIINDILDISKIESGKLEMEKRDFDLRELLENVANILKPKAESKNIEFSIEYGNIDHFYYKGDVLRISQVLTNLLNNAIKFTQEGYVKVEVRLLENQQLYFVVKDSGIGLKEESLESLFDEFTQADMSTSRKYGGTGLGLSISKNLVALMGGTLSVTSKFGEGSSFYVTLPLEKVIKFQESQSKELESIEIVTEKVNKLKNVKILVAEDNKMNQMVLDMLLEDTQLELEFADDGEIAVSKFKEGSYNFILMDLQMPNLDGYGATKAIRQFDSKVPIIALSANVLKEDIDKAFESGINAYLAKPIELEKLFNVILKYTQEESS